MINKKLLNEIMQDLSFCGKYSDFYEMLQEELEKYSKKQIKELKCVLKSVYPKLSKEIDAYDKMRVLYEYSNIF